MRRQIWTPQVGGFLNAPADLNGAWIWQVLTTLTVKAIKKDLAVKAKSRNR
jgi:hypothetical protein